MLNHPIGHKHASFLGKKEEEEFEIKIDFFFVLPLIFCSSSSSDCFLSTSIRWTSVLAEKARNCGIILMRFQKKKIMIN